MNKYIYIASIIMFFLLTGMHCGSGKWIKYFSETTVELTPNPVRLTNGQIKFIFKMTVPPSYLDKYDSLVYVITTGENTPKPIYQFRIDQTNKVNSKGRPERIILINELLQLTVDSTNIYLYFNAYRKDTQITSPTMVIGKIVKDKR